MSLLGRRRRPAQSNESDDEDQSTQRQYRRRFDPNAEDDSGEDVEDEADDGPSNIDVEGDNQDQLVKKLVRYVLACEYQRMPIQRTKISDNVIGKQRGQFKHVFESAQRQLRTRFGMEMVELPVKEKHTLKDRRAAQKSKSISKTATSWILVSTLPIAFRSPEIIPPISAGDPTEEAAYVGLYTFIVSIIMLSPTSSLSQAKLETYLSRVQALQNMPMDKTVMILDKMRRQGYIDRTVERTENDETVEWRVGPRGKMEVDKKGVRGLVLHVYGENAPDDLDQKLQRSLKMDVVRVDPRSGVLEEEEEEE